ncbi:MAG: response regulator transcription factor [Sulfuricurvum sp.]
MALPTLQELKSVTASLSVLYVEDEAMLREGLASSLRQLFKKVEVAEDGAIGLELYKHALFDLIVTDISMPNMDGIAMIEQIKRIDPRARIIVTSAQNDADKLLTLINLGVERFLTKPINKSHLIEGLFSVCNAITAINNAERYRHELEQKVRLLNTQLKKEYVKTVQATAISPQNEKNTLASFEDYHHHIFQEEVDELCDLNEELDADILLAFQNDAIDHEYAVQLSQRYNRYGTILARHPAFNEIGIAIQTLSNEIDLNHEVLFEHLKPISELLESFNFALITFRKNIIEKPSVVPTFYNASILSDISMIVNMLQQKEINGEIEFF